MSAYNALISSTRSSANTLPAQAIPTKDKNQTWLEDVLDTSENIGMAQYEYNKRKFEDAYAIIDGSFKYSDISKSSLFLAEVDFLRNQADLSQKLENYGFIEPLVNKMTMDFMKKPQPFIITATDEISTNEYIREKTDRLWEYVAGRLEAEIKKKAMKAGFNPDQEFSSEEEQQQFQQQYQEFSTKNTPEDIEREMNSSWKAQYIKWAELTIKDDYNRFDIDEIDRDLVYDYFITGRCFKHFKVSYDKYFVERWSPIETFVIGAPTRYPEEADGIGRVRLLTPTKVLKDYGYLLNEKQTEEITDSDDYKSKQGAGKRIGSAKDWITQGGGTLMYSERPNPINKKNLEYIQSITGIDLGMTGTFPNGNLPLFNEREGFWTVNQVRVTEVYWTSFQKMYAIRINDKVETFSDELLPEFFKENGIKKLKAVSLEQFEKDPQNNTYIVYYPPQVWQGVKISKDSTNLDEDIYWGQPLDFQIKGFSDIYDTLLPISGLLDRTSVVSRLETYQRDYNIAVNMARDYMAKELGSFLLMDFAFLPTYIKDLGGDEALVKLIDTVKELGILPIDGSAQNTKGSNFNQFTRVDIDYSNNMQGKLAYASMIKQQAYELILSNTAVMGQQNEQLSPTGVKQAVSASLSQVDFWYDKLSKMQLRGIQILLNVAQFAKTNGKDITVNYADSEITRYVINSVDKYITLRHFRITPEINAKGRADLEMLKQTFFQDNTIQKTLEDMTQVMSSDSISRILQLAKLSRQRTELMRQQEQMARQQEIQAQGEEQRKTEELLHANKLEEIRLKGEIDLNKQAILALGFADDKDANKNNVQDIVEQLNAATNRLKVEYGKISQDNKIESDKLTKEREFALEKEALMVKQGNNEAKKYAADKALEIARENKYSYETNKNK
jgi:hypothetical protein